MDGDASYRGCTRVVAMVLLAILGIPAAILTLASVILCFWVFLAKLHEHGAKGAWKMAKGVFSCWGYVDCPLVRSSRCVTSVLRMVMR